MRVAGVPSERIVVLGQSLGTAVTSGVAEHFAIRGIEFAGIICEQFLRSFSSFFFGDLRSRQAYLRAKIMPENPTLSKLSRLCSKCQLLTPRVVVIAGFSNVPTLLSTYNGAGFIPVLSPLRPIPPLLRLFQSFIVDRWDSASRLAEIVRLTRTRLRLTLIHAKDDMEIPCHESDVLFKSAANATIDQVLDNEAFLSWKNQRSTRFDDGTFISIATAEPDITIRQELVPYGGMDLSAHPCTRNNSTNLACIGHNRVMLSSAVALAVMRTFSSDSNGSIR